MDDRGFTAWEALKPLVTWVLVVLGWVVLADQQELRESKKDGLARLANLRHELTAAHVRIRQFHASHFSADEQVGIQADVSALGHTCDFLERAGFLSGGWTTGLRQFRQAATTENFDVSTHSPLTLQSDVISGVAIAYLRFDRFLSQAEFQALTRPVTIWGSIARVSRINRFVSWLDTKRALKASKCSDKSSGRAE
jgi:hypothetical protein